MYNTEEQNNSYFMFCCIKEILIQRSAKTDG